MTHSSSYLRARTAIIISMNAMIGAGIFAVPLALQKAAGPIGLITVLITALMVWCLAFSLGSIAAKNTHATSFYEYIEPWGGHWLASLVTIMHTSGMVIAMGLLIQELGFILYGIAPWFQAMIWSGLMLSIILLITLQGTMLSTWGQYLLIGCTVIPLTIISMLCFFHMSLSNIIPFAPHGIIPAIAASKIIIFGYFGFECVSSLAPLLQYPQRDMPRILTISIILVSCIYLFFISSFILAMPPALLAEAPQSFIEALLLRFPKHIWILRMVNIAIISALTGTVHSMLWSLKAILISLKKDWGVFPGTPSVLLVLSALIIFGMCIFISSSNTFFSLTALCVVPTYFVTITTIFVRPTQFSMISKFCGIVGWIAAIIITLSALYTLGT
jgi:amino acid transporter